MRVRHPTTVSPRAVKLAAAVVIGLSLGGVVPPNPSLLEWLGPVPGVFAGALGAGLGAIVYTQVPRRLTATECGCVDDCGCG